jgi:CRISPR/Cas system CMR-associated protein Cmr5 small subunit
LSASPSGTAGSITTRGMTLRLIFYSSNLQGIDRAAKIAPEKTAWHYILVDWLGWAGSAGRCAAT